MQLPATDQHAVNSIAFGDCVAHVSSQSMPVVGGRALDVWRSHKQFAANINAVCPDTCNDAMLHAPELVRRLRGLIAACDPKDCAIIYVHRGYQPRYRTPLFQSLLSQLPSVGGHFSHRSADNDLPAEVYSLILSSLTQFRDVLVVWDKVDRLLPVGSPAAQPASGPLAVIYGMRSDGAGGFLPRSHVAFYHSNLPHSPSNREVSDYVAR